MSSPLKIPLLVLFLSSALLPAQGSVTRLTNDVYLFAHGFHSSIFIVTSEGVIATDPMSVPAARAYRKAIRKVTDLPVRYVIYSHDHTDHVGGGEIFRPEARFVAHALAEEIIVERAEPSIVVPDLTFEGNHEITLGGKRVELLYFGPIESESSIAIYVPQDRVLMWTDSVRSYGVPYRYLEGYNLRRFRKALRGVEKLEIDHFAPQKKGTVYFVPFS